MQKAFFDKVALHRKKAAAFTVKANRMTYPRYVKNDGITILLMLNYHVAMHRGYVVKHGKTRIEQLLLPLQHSEKQTL